MYERHKNGCQNWQNVLIFVLENKKDFFFLNLHFWLKKRGAHDKNWIS